MHAPSGSDSVASVYLPPPRLFERIREDEDPDASGGDGFHRQAELIAYATELKAAAADYWDSEDGTQCRERLAEIAANDAFIEKNHAAIAAREQAEREQAGQNQSPMHA